MSKELQSDRELDPSYVGQERNAKPSYSGLKKPTPESAYRLS